MKIELLKTTVRGVKGTVLKSTDSTMAIDFKALITAGYAKETDKVASASAKVQNGPPISGLRRPPNTKPKPDVLETKDA